MTFPPLLQWKTARPKLCSMRGLIGRFGRDRSATTAIEFAMIVVPFFGLIGAIFETGMVYFHTAELQTATESAKRILLTHRSAAGSNQKFINDNVCTWQSSGKVAPGTLSKSFDCSKVMISVTKTSGVWSTFNTDGVDIYDTPGKPYSSTADITLPAAGEVAIVRILYPMPVIAAILGGSAFNQNYTRTTQGRTYENKTVHMLVGVAAFRVEPN